jgi:hypothetical protein
MVVVFAKSFFDFSIDHHSLGLLALAFGLFAFLRDFSHVSFTLLAFTDVSDTSIDHLGCRISNVFSIVFACFEHGHVWLCRTEKLIESHDW